MPRLFLHFFDQHFLDEVARHVPDSVLLGEMDMAVRLSLLASSQVLVPCSSYFEVDAARQVLDSFAAVWDRDVIGLVGSQSSVREFAAAKLLQYRPGSSQHAAYTGLLGGVVAHPPYRPRLRSASSDLVREWNDVLTVPSWETTIFPRATAQLPLTFEQDWALVPERLGEEAFIPSYVTPLLLDANAPPLLSMRIGNFINRGYFASFARELDAGFVVDMHYLRSRHDLDATDYLSYGAAVAQMRSSGVYQRVLHTHPEALLELKDDPMVVSALLSAIEATPRAPAQPRLIRPSAAEVQTSLAAVVKVAPGKAGAAAYQKAVARLLGLLFVDVLGPPVIETEINEGRKRIDFTMVNNAEKGFFRWVARNFGAPWVYCEAKNYKEDPSNPELDQLAGRFTQRVRFGFMLCRTVKNRPLLTQRCRDIATAQHGLVIVLDDEDLKTLVALHAGDDPDAALTTWLHTTARTIAM